MSVFHLRERLWPHRGSDHQEPRHRRRRTTVSDRFVVWWAAAIIVWDADDPAAVEQLVNDARSFCFAVYVEAATFTVARSLAIAGLRAALLSAGIALGPTATWAPLVLDLDP